jgi:hypothetical protein
MQRRYVLVALAFIAWGLVWGSHKTATAAPPQNGGRIGEAKLAENPIEVLGGRLTVRAPQGAKLQAPPHSIMGAAESEQRETRVIFDAGQERMVLMVHEAFALAGDDFENGVRKWVAEFPAKYRIESDKHIAKGLRAVTVTPVNNPDHSHSNDATFVAGVLVASADQTIQSLDVYVNAAAEKDLEGCKRVARAILSSAAPGKKQLQLAAGQRRLFAYSKDVEISIVVPENTAAMTQVGDDFLVHRLIVLERLGIDSGGIGVYVGEHPDFRPKLKTGEGTMFGQKIEWHSSHEGKGLETVCKLPVPGHKLTAHVWIHASNKAQLATLQQAAETMTLVKAASSGGAAPTQKAAAVGD